MFYAIVPYIVRNNIEAGGYRNFEITPEEKLETLKKLYETETEDKIRKLILYQIKEIEDVINVRNDLIMFYESIVENRNQKCMMKIISICYPKLMLEYMYGSRIEQHFLKTMFGVLDEKKKRKIDNKIIHL